MPKHTIPSLQKRASAGEKLVMVTAYDASMARIVDDAGVDMILVGDSLGMVVQGADNTLSVTMDDILYHTRAVRRGSANTHLIADMPFMSYQLSKEQAMRNAGRALSEGGAEAVKIEGGAEYADTIEAMVRCGIPVMGHVGLLPQHVHAMGGFRMQGKNDEAAKRILADAKAVANAGAYTLVLEGIPASLSKKISEELDIPTIGIGAGPHCDGQVLVCYDLLGFNPDFKPKFLKRYDDAYSSFKGAFENYAAEVRGGHFPATEHYATKSASAGDSADAKPKSYGPE